MDEKRKTPGAMLSGASLRPQRGIHRIDLALVRKSARVRRSAGRGDCGADVIPLLPARVSAQRLFLPIAAQVLVTGLDGLFREIVDLAQRFPKFPMAVAVNGVLHFRR